MSKQSRNPTFIQTPAAVRRVRHIVTGLILGGGLIAATAIVLAVPEPEPEAEPIAVESAPAPRPEWANKFETPATPAAPEAAEPEAAPEPVAPEAPAIELAIAHQDETTDFADLAQRQLDTGDVKDALTSMRKHIFAREATVDELFLIGNLARQTHEGDLAKAALQAAVKLQPERSDLQTELGRVYLEGKALAEAEAAAEEAVRLDRENPAAWNLSGRIAMAKSEWQRAEAALLHALELDPTNAMYHNNAGLLYIYMRRGDDAVESLETAVELFEDQAEHFVFNNLGLAHELAGNYEEAREAFEEALLMNPYYSRAKVNLRRVETTMAQIEAKNAFQTASVPAAEEVEESPGVLEVGDDT